MATKKPFEHVLIVMFENQYRSYVQQNAFMQKLAAAGAEMTNFFGVFHPSQTNYIASLCGETCGVTNDTPPSVPLQQQNLVDLLEEAGISWKAYMEAYPNEPWNPLWQKSTARKIQEPINEYPNDGSSLARYFRKHNAFASARSIQADQQRWEKIVDENAFWKDSQSGDLPQYAWFTPDIWNDGHYLYNTHLDTNPRTELVPQLAAWLEYVFLGNPAATKVQGSGTTGLDNIGLNLGIDLLLTDPATAWKQSRLPEGTLLVVTFDEADFDAEGYDTNYDGPNQIYTVLLGDMIEPGTKIDTPHNHYSLMKTIQKNFGLGSLGKNDWEANYIRELWGEQFVRQTPQVGVQTTTPTRRLAATDTGSGTAVVRQDSKQLLELALCQEHLEPFAEIGLKADGDIALAFHNGLHLVYALEGRLYHATSTDGYTWEAQALGKSTEGTLALTRFRDYADQQEKLMLCWRADNGFLQSMVYAAGAWEKQESVGQLTDGDLALSAFGPSIFLVYKERNTRKLRMTSYNTAPFNAFAAQDFEGNPAPENDTSLHEWSPMDWPVGHFAQKFAANQDTYQTSPPMAMAAIEGGIHLVYRAAYQDQPYVYATQFGLTGIVTAKHWESNKYGTLEQAGWTEEEQLDLEPDPQAGMAMASSGQVLTLVWVDVNSGKLMFQRAGYEKAAPTVHK